MMASLSESSIKQYDVCLKKWWSFCQAHSVEPYEATIPTVISFLTNLFTDGYQYGSLNSYRSALSLILGPTLAKDEYLHRFFKGVFRLRPPVPKYNATWDTSCVLNHLSIWYPNEELDLCKLSKKTITLLALTTAHRLQTISKINVKNIETSDDRISIKIPDILKTSRPGCKQPVLFLPFFNDKPSICPAKTLQIYISKTESLRTSEMLFIGLKKPHNAVGTQTLSRWIKRTLGECGVDTAVFTAHSTRHAAASAAHSLGVSVDTIRSTAGWSHNSSTFARFYNRVVGDADLALARTIIDNHSP
ncbi:uncharacterized protein LOC126380656 [Pectinophora gossypiella]|uniref:uncharacterized protein LOC126380656 n=1 Tax=Pectinophora gossypiella TaxID=13191 RepID=UPI00214EEB60|nr:uncharacterized protein LOC126380656 [Pectinophora gossypiella]XP_049886179.1 uncharacterized protein LOC126380656 [Pectinophora gossypiella]